MIRLVVLGDLVTDVVARLHEPIAEGSDAAAGITSTGGGSGANVARWLAASSADVAFVGRVGTDPAGVARTSELAAAGVEVHVTADRALPTGTVVVLVNTDGERTMLADRGANLALQAGDLPAHLFRAGDHLHLSGYTLLGPGPRPAGLAALEMARAAGMTISVDPSSVQPLAAAGVERFLTWTHGADLCLPNLAEARLLSGADSPEQAARDLCMHYRQTVVTLGPRGALWSDGAQVRRAAAEAVARVVDTTGAGDAFTAGYLAAWLQGRDVDQRLRQGALLAGRAVATAGAGPAGP